MPKPNAATTKQRLRSATRSISQPARSFLNDHFEMTKGQVRRSADQVVHEVRLQQLSVDELGNVIAETQLHHAKLLGELRRQNDELLGEVRRLAELIEEQTNAGTPPAT